MEYFALREEQKIEALRKEIEDEEFLFGQRQGDLTEEEIKRHELNKRILEKAEERIRLKEEVEEGE